MLETLKHYDTELFLFLNRLHSSFFDDVFVIVTQRFTWIPFYALLLYFSWKKYGNAVWKYLIAIVLLIICADQLSVFIKNYVQRYRPCHNLTLQNIIHLVNGECGGQFGFISSHATNSMALTVFTCLTIFRQNRLMTGVMFFYALVVSYSRIYLGMHYPLDIICGFMVGALTGHGIFLFSKNNKLV